MADRFPDRVADALVAENVTGYEEGVVLLNDMRQRDTYKLAKRLCHEGASDADVVRLLRRAITEVNV